MNALHRLLLLLPFLVGANAELSSSFRSDFSETVLIDGLDSPTDLAFAPDGSDLCLVAEQGGIVYAVSNVAAEGASEGSVEKYEVADLADLMCHNGSRGLVGVAFHPAYPSAGGMWAYVFYTANSGDCYTGKWDVDNVKGTINRLSRFPIVSGGDGRISLDGRSEDVLLETPVQMIHNHNGGDIEFGHDGMLYLTLGDGASNKLKNDAGLPFEQALDVLFGKIVRLTPDGEIPPDNPYTPAYGYDDAVFCGRKDGYSGSAKRPCAEIYASGLRNPFRFAFDPNASTEDDVRFWINDVGGGTFERILEGKKGGNYGYPDIKGPCSADFENGGRCEEPEEFGFDPSVHWYKHDSEMGACITGGAFIPSGIGWPSDFDGSYLYGEYKIGGIYRISKGKGCPASDCPRDPTSDYDTTEFSDATATVSMSFGPYRGGTPKALYYLTRGAGRGSNEKGRPEGLVRIAYLGTHQTNNRPVASVETDVAIGFNPLTVAFDGTGSSDPDGDALSFAWDLDGDGSVDSTVPRPTFVYTNPGKYEATLTVTDGGGATDQISVDITVDNSPPVPVIRSPADYTQFAVGDSIRLAGSATDSEDGALPASSLSWEIREHHGDHYHVIMGPTPGGGEVQYVAPGPAEMESARTSYLQVVLSATDSRGLTAQAVRTLRPGVVSVNLDSSPSGLDVVVSGRAMKTPTTVAAWENQEFEIHALGDESGSYQFTSWSDGGERTHMVKAGPSGSLDIVAYFDTTEEPATTEGTAPEEPAEEGTEEPAAIEATAPEQPAKDEAQEEDEEDMASVSGNAVGDTDNVELLEFSVIINLDSYAADGSRKLNTEEGKNSPAITYLKENFEDILSAWMKKELRTLVRASDLPYAQPTGVKLAHKKNRVSKEGKRFKAIFDGSVAFKKKKEDQQFPTRTTVQSMQVQVLSRVGDTLVDDISESLPGKRVSSVKSEVEGKAIAPPVEDSVGKREPTSEDSSETEADIVTESSEPSGEDSGNNTNLIIMVACIIVAGFVIIAIAIFVFRSRPSPPKGKWVDLNQSGETHGEPMNECDEKREEEEPSYTL